MRCLLAVFFCLVSVCMACAQSPADVPPVQPTYHESGGGDGFGPAFVSAVFSVPSLMSSTLNVLPDSLFGRPNDSRRWRSGFGKVAGGLQMLVGGIFLVNNEREFGLFNLALGGISYQLGKQTESRIQRAHVQVSPIVSTASGRADRGMALHLSLRL
jgi:hypothetical protein